MPAAPADEASRLAALRARLAVPMPNDRPWGWLGPLLVTAFGAFLRFDRLRVPRALIFDETYYAKDAWALVHRGFEVNWDKNANDLILSTNGHVTIPTDAAYVVHPPVGKYVIGLGELIFGFNPFGWRFMTALLGTLSVLMLCRIGRRLFRTDLDLKRSAADARVLLERLVVELCGGRRSYGRS